MVSPPLTWFYSDFSNYIVTAVKIYSFCCPTAAENVLLTDSGGFA